MYVCEICSTTQGNENKLLTYERETLKKYTDPCLTPILVYTNGEKTADLSRLCNASNLQNVLWPKKLERSGRVRCAEGRLTRQALVNVSNEKDPWKGHENVG